MKIKQLTKKYFPAEEKYWLTDQIIRASNSIVLNIAEGADRGTDKDFALFLNRSHTSLNEVVACLDIALKEKYITVNIHDQFLQEAENLASQITAFRRKLFTTPTK
ncbi:four helix bundle protein [Candidatus Curtissbacteria bacterium]|nr:four helix bundle protein [Candidatus Curtissbacteria bacterium]